MTYDKKIVRREPQVPQTELLVINKRKGWICMDEMEKKPRLAEIRDVNL